MPLIIQEGVNLFLGDNPPNNSKHLNLEGVRLPDLEEMTQNFHPGGGVGQIEVGGMGLKALELTFKLKGWDPQAMSQFGLGSPSQIPYTIYGVARDKNGNVPLEVKAIVRGRMTKLTADEIKRGDLMGHDFAIKEVLHYELYFDKLEKYWYDFLGSDWRVDGVSQNSVENSILRIPITG
jgi:P2 family phage contractile tail tube protein